MKTANDKVTLCIRKPELSKESINNDVHILFVFKYINTRMQ